jgi:hypothetical protein
MTVTDRESTTSIGVNPQVSNVSESFDVAVAAEVQSCVAGLLPEDLDRIVAQLDTGHAGVPREIDRPLLARLRNRMDRELSADERKHFSRLLKNPWRWGR